MALEHFKLPRDDWYDITNWDYRDKEVYDPSKFTVVGSPTITDDGVASGWSLSNYVEIPDVQLQSAETWEIEGILNLKQVQTNAATWLSPRTGNGLMLPIYVTDTYVKFQLYLSSSSSDWDIAHYEFPAIPRSTGEAYKCNLKYTGAQYIYTIADATTGKILKTHTVDSTTKIYQSPTALGIKRSQVAMSSDNSIDLKAFSIIVDGQEAFKGTKTVQEKVPPKGEIVGRLYKEALIENFNAIEAKLNELSGLTAYETQVPDFSNYNYEDVTLDSPNNKVVNLQSFLKIMNLIGVPIECRFTGKLCNKVTYYDRNMKYHTIVNQKLDDLGTDGKVYIVLDSSNDTVSAVSDITVLTNKFLLGVYDNGRVYNLRSSGLVDINVLTHLCDMSVEPFFIGSLNGTKKTEGIYRNGRIIGAWGRESKGAYPKDITLFDIGRQ